jgi:FAD/FMN-containing dehydrogenase
MILSGWGRYPRLDCRLTTPRDMAGVIAAAATGSAIARGNGRAYGDSALNPAQTIGMRGLNRMLAFDEDSGQLVAEAGVMLSEIIDVFLPRGWFPAVTPGTKYVTLGGAIAADVHGKNHHKHGSFATCVDWVEVLGPDGTIRRLTPADDLFGWTVGGMGLTGIILRAAIRLARVETGWIRQTQTRARGLAEAIAQFEAAQAATYSVAWIDCLATGAAMGRSLVMLGEHALVAELGPDQARDPFVTRRRKTKTVPFDVPGFALNRLSVGAFNMAYYANGLLHQGESLIDFDSYFYPLDALLEWNRIYGRAGFAQFQCVVPLAAAEAGLGALLKRIAASGQGSFLAVLKRMGAQHSRFSFPMEGYTLALDFPMRQGTARLLGELQAIAVDHGGRFYLAKDSVLDAATLRRSDARADTFAAMRREAGLTARFASAQSERLSL